MILSAAHCSKRFKKGTQVLVGAYEDWNDRGSGGRAQFFQVDKVWTHSKFNTNYEYDFLGAYEEKRPFFAGVCLAF